MVRKRRRSRSASVFSNPSFDAKVIEAVFNLEFSVIYYALKVG